MVQTLAGAGVERLRGLADDGARLCRGHARETREEKVRPVSGSVTMTEGSARSTS